jgi:cytochrome oxidase Cu insertion factor (SCO1/SenC/PrrC family)
MARAGAGSIAAAGALGVVLVGVVPSAAASVGRQADPIIAEAIGRSPGLVNYPAGNFILTDQHGAPVSLASLHGKVVLLTFLDPVCTTDCPLIGHELVAAGRMLAADSSRIRLAAIVLSPTYRSLAAIQAYDRQEGLNRNPDWLYMTGSLPQLENVWREYNVNAQDLPGGAMTLHNDVGYVIDGQGHVRRVLDTNPGPGTSASVSSFAVQFADAARQVLDSS